MTLACCRGVKRKAMAKGVGRLMKCISIRQPWAQLIADKLRPIEFRSWKIAYRGPLLIHAATTTDAKECKRFGIQAPVTGCILCKTELAGIIEINAFLWEAFRVWHLELGDFPGAKARFAWFLVNTEKLPVPIPYKGRQRLFDVPETVLEKGGVRP